MLNFSRVGDFILSFRWWLMALVGGLLIFYETLAHVQESIREHGVNFLFEALIMGVVAPVLGGYLLTNLARFKAENARNKERLDRYLPLFDELKIRQDWKELRSFLVHYPGTFLPLDCSSLHIYDYRLGRLEFAAEWKREEVNSLSSVEPTVTTCQTCLASQQGPFHPAERCPFIVRGLENHPPREYCLTLSYHNVLIGILRLTLQQGRIVTPEQIEFMDSIASEFALAITLSLTRAREIAAIRLQTQFMERQQTAIELHNSLAQQIGYLHLSLDRLASDGQLLISDLLRGELERMRQVASEAYEQVRSAQTLLRSWGSADLSRVIGDYLIKVSRRAHLSNAFTTSGTPVLLPPEISRQVFSLLQESLNNVEKHAQAKTVRCDLIWSPDSLSMNITDDGVGFEPAFAQTDEHYGLAMMLELVSALQGKLDLTSSPGHGTRLNFTIPLTHLETHPLSEKAPSLGGFVPR